MGDSNAHEHPDAKHEHSREQRSKGIKRWVEYINSESPEMWGHSGTQSSTTSSTQLKACGLRLLTDGT